MLIGGRLRTAVESIRIADPICPVDVHPAPLVGILVFIDMFIGNAEDIQTQAGSACASGAGGGALNEVSIRIIIMGTLHRILHPAVKPLANGVGNTLELFLQTETGIGRDQLHRFGVGQRQLVVSGLLL